MRLLQPEMAAWLLVLPVASIAWGLRYSQRWRHRRRWPLTGRGQRRTRRLRDLATLGFALVSLCLLAFALMRPQIRAERVTPTFEKQDMVLILDRSVSMRARDVHPSRSARAVAEIEGFLARKPPTLDRIALVGFAATSVVLSYPTSDLDSLFFYLEWVRDDPSALYGTDMTAALETALSVVNRERTAAPPPVFVLISDGEDQGGGLERTASAVRRAGIRLYTVGIGSADAVAIPIQDETGREALLEDENGQVMRTRFREGTLRQLAALTGGQYFRSASGGELSSALDRILSSERRQTGTVSKVEYVDIHLWLLAAAAAGVIGLVTTW